MRRHTAAVDRGGHRLAEHRRALHLRAVGQAERERTRRVVEDRALGDERVHALGVQRATLLVDDAEATVVLDAAPA